MPHRRSSHRKARNPQARQLVVGADNAPDILHKGRRAHLAPVNAQDHRSRYRAGQRLAVKEMVPGPTACHVIVTEVTGPKDGFTLGQVTYPIARDLGHVRLDEFWWAMVVRLDQAWLARMIDQDTLTEDAVAERFQARWHAKLAWLLRFDIDRAAPPHLLAARSDELYVENPAMALRDELPALTPDEWERHISPASRYREAERVTLQLEDRAARGREERLQDARARARAKGYDIRDELRRYERLTQNGQQEKALKQLELLEARVFPIAA